ncbi:hypothetical protein CPC16_009851 [Podila verticillata]|nr:hypothetical protein BGZ59_003033 [Podila verticillata]KAF9394906.1 hypothetical protein CPC16_009851 [Podila verticillata]KFH65544.1 50S ribosomal protein L1 [Podila verticillata NRRL 6337]
MLDIKQAGKAAKALLGHLEKEGQNKNQLLEEDQAIWLIIATKKFSDASKAKPYRIPLKHSIVAPDAEVCLFVKDPQKDYKRLLEEKQVKAVNKVIGVSKLRAKYKPYEAKRQLCASYGMFLADARVVTVLPKLLGKTFFLKKKQPIPVDMTKADLKKEIARAIGSTYMHQTTGTCTAVKIGLTSMSAAEITANIEAAIPHIIEKIPRKWKNIQAINLKSNESIALPIFNSLPEEGVTRIDIHGKKSEALAMDEDEEDEEEDDE